jgi:2-polyprenyl-3-methyl-5-hydroxy-6-metoxy-1,4-benzoquinol methylase
MEEQIVSVIMGDNCSKFIDMNFKSVLDSDKIIFCWGMEDIPTLNKFNEWKEKYPDKFELIQNKYIQGDNAMNGKQRNFYLKFAQENYPGWFCLALDADEVVEEFNKLREWINKFGVILKNTYPCISVRMRHFIGDLGHEDATLPEHFVPRRLFYIIDGLNYPEVEHPVLNYAKKQSPENWNCRATTIWHLAYIPNLWDIKKRYENHLKKSNMHTPEYLRNWYKSHLFGEYPISKIDKNDIPKIILEEFNIDKDEIYFSNRGLEVKHFILSKQYLDYFRPTNVLDMGCGLAPYGFAIRSLNSNIFYLGIDKSKFAITNSMVPKHVLNVDVLEYKDESIGYDLVMAIDILEHLNYEDLDKAINNIISNSVRFILVSVPTIGDVNLEADKTHKIKESKEWWRNKFLEKGVKEVKVPNNFLFKEQLMIFIK